jgi:hypothetical protein
MEGLDVNKRIRGVAMYEGVHIVCISRVGKGRPEKIFLTIACVLIVLKWRIETISCRSETLVFNDKSIYVNAWGPREINRCRHKVKNI